MEIDKIIKKDVLEFMETIPDNKIDLIVTDPPYLINYKTNWRKEKHKFSNVIKQDCLRLGVPFEDVYPLQTTLF